jgi:hypothetical protein
VCSRIIVAKATDDFVVDDAFVPIADVATANIVQETRGAKRRRAGADGVKARVKAWMNVGDKLPSSKLQWPFKGAYSHLDYDDILKFKASSVASSFKVAQYSNVVGESP